VTQSPQTLPNPERTDSIGVLPLPALQAEAEAALDARFSAHLGSGGGLVDEVDDT
jgi:hypothetical protein